MYVCVCVFTDINYYFANQGVKKMQDAVCVCTPPEIFFFFLPMQRELNGVERGKKYMMFKLLTLCLCRLLDFTPRFCTDILANSRPTYLSKRGMQIVRRIHQSL